MHISGMLTGTEAADYPDQRLKDLWDQMTEDELRRAMIPVWLVKVIEPGSDEAHTCRINAEDAPNEGEAETVAQRQRHQTIQTERRIAPYLTQAILRFAQFLALLGVEASRILRQ